MTALPLPAVVHGSWLVSLLVVDLLLLEPGSVQDRWSIFELSVARVDEVTFVSQLKTPVGTA